MREGRCEQMKPEGLLVVTPMVVKVNEEIDIKVKVLGPVHKIPSKNFGENGLLTKPRLAGPFNQNPARGINYLDNVLPEWAGTLKIDGGKALSGPGKIEINENNRGVFSGDTRPIRHCQGWKWNEPGLHWIRVSDPESGIQEYSNPVFVKKTSPDNRIYWGDPHWQSFLTDGLRIPEELYAFARDEAFLDFGAASDHAEGLTDRQWQYFTGVTNDYNQIGKFVTLVGLEWTSKKWGHRNIYYKSNSGPIIRSNDSDYDSLTKIWKFLEKSGIEAIAIPHHTANVEMGVNWNNGWNSKYEKAVEIHSVWGNSEIHEDEGNLKPIRTNGGEKKGQHVIDALKRGYRFGFVGGGDIHDGRPGDDLHSYQSKPEQYKLLHPQGFTAVKSSCLSRENIYEGIKSCLTYATTSSRIYIDMFLENKTMGQNLRLSNAKKGKLQLNLVCAAPEPICKAVFVHNGKEEFSFIPADENNMVIKGSRKVGSLEPGDFCYIRLITESQNMAWTSPIWIEE